MYQLTHTDRQGAPRAPCRFSNPKIITYTLDMKNLKTRLIKSLPKPIISFGKKIRTKKILGRFERTGKIPYPEIAIIDPSNLCNLNCPLCPTGRKCLKQKQSFMSPKNFSLILSKIPSLKHISLFNWGEPFLNPQIFEIIKIAKQKDIFISLHSNFSFPKKPEFFEKLILSETDHIEISLDGLTQKNYSAYRKNGNVDLVIADIKRLNETKKRLGKTNPKITWKFIVNKFNEEELDKARKKSREIGIDFTVSTIGLADDLPDCQFPESLEERKSSWLPKNKRHIRKHYLKEKLSEIVGDGICDQLFTSITIGPNGNVYPCCWITDEKNSFGNLFQEEFEDIWNGMKYQEARKLFSKKKSPTETVGDLVCKKCQNFRKD